MNMSAEGEVKTGGAPREDAGGKNALRSERPGSLEWLVGPMRDVFLGVSTADVHDRPRASLRGFGSGDDKARYV